MMKTDLELLQEWLEGQIRELEKIQEPDHVYHYYHQHKEEYPKNYVKLKREWDEAQQKIRNFKEVQEQILFFQCQD